MQRIDLTGQRFARLLVVNRAGRTKSRSARWLCRCDCGADHVVDGRALTTGKSKSCGCLKRDRLSARLTTHGMAFSRTYRSWSAMRGRCGNTKNKRYARYGGRGITVCERWSVFDNFLLDMGERPAGATLGRIDNDGNYEPSNCRWETPKQQSRNTRLNVLRTHNGKTQCIADWAAEYGIRYRTLLRRVNDGWPFEMALRTPVQQSGKNHCRRGHPLSGDNLRFDTDGKRRCAACRLHNQRAFYARLKAAKAQGAQ